MNPEALTFCVCVLRKEVRNGWFTQDVSGRDISPDFANASSIFLDSRDGDASIGCFLGFQRSFM